MTKPYRLTNIVYALHWEAAGFLGRKSLKSYLVGAVTTTFFRETFLVAQNGSTENVKRWVGRLLIAFAAVTGILSPVLTAAETVPIARFVQALGKSHIGSYTELANAALRSQEVLRQMAAAYGMSVPEYYIETNAPPNAYVNTQGGRPVMVISTAMLKLAGESDDMLAVVIGHELGHLKADHLNKTASTQLFFGLIGAVIGAAIDDRQARRGVDTQGLGRTLGNIGAGLAIAKFSRDDEREADDLGVKAMAAAGFDPQAATRLWQRMSSVSNGGSGLWMSSHPAHPEREQALAALAASMPSVPRQAVANAEPSLAPDPFPASSVVSLAPNPSDLSGQSLYLRGGRAIRQQQFSDGIALMKEAAEAGDERAMYVLGKLYAEGDQKSGVRADIPQAIVWLERSTQKGFAAAISYLGWKKIADSSNYGGAYDGVSLLRWADARGDAQAASMLGFAFLLGRGVPRDEKLSTKYAKAGMERGSASGKALYATLRILRAKSADEAQPALEMLRESTSGFPAAHYLTGLLYEGGFGVPKDRERALSAYRLAESAGFNGAKARIDRLTKPISSEVQ